MPVADLDRRRSGPAEGLRDDDGSNAFALSGRKTTSGAPILLANPHLQWRQLYWEAHITVPGRVDFYGSTLVGFPWLRAGFNDRLGYVQTNNDPDTDDIFALPLDPARPDHYRFEGKPRPLDPHRGGGGGEAGRRPADDRAPHLLALAPRAHRLSQRRRRRSRTGRRRWTRGASSRASGG